MYVFDPIRRALPPQPQRRPDARRFPRSPVGGDHHRPESLDTRRNAVTTLEAIEGVYEACPALDFAAAADLTRRLIEAGHVTVTDAGWREDEENEQ